MSRAELEAGKAIQRPFENQMRERDGGFEWIADHVSQHAIALKPFLEVRNTLRMHENQDTHFLSLGPERVELGVGQLLAVYASPDGCAAQPQFLDALFQLLDRQVRTLP